MNIPKIISLTAFAAAATVAMFLLSSCQKGGENAKPADVDYYTCTMHPSVRSQDPKGKCPICSMGLVPVKKKSMTAALPSETGQPTEFIVPLERQQQIGVTYATVATQPFHYAIRAVGLVASDQQRRWDYVTRVPGYAQKLFVFSPGEMVESNAPVLTLFSPELFTAQKEFVNALDMRDRARSNNSPDVLRSADDLVAATRERFRLWDVTGQQIAGLEKTRQPQENLTLYSPFKGIVENIGVEQGRKIMPGDRLVDIDDLSVVWVWAQFYQDDLPLLKQGASVTLALTSSPDEKFDGKISVIDPSINDATRAARVRIDVDNPDFKLRPDMYVNVELSGEMGRGLAVPASAVLPTGLHDIAFVDKGDGKLEPRYLELGRKYGDFYEVKSGLKENERVVASANFLIDAEAKIQGALKVW